MHNYATLFDMGYFPKWYVMYRSWLRWRTNKSDTMWVMPMNLETHLFMKKNGPWEGVELLNPVNVMGKPTAPGRMPIHLQGIRPWPEFCWTMAPWLCHHLIFDLHKEDVIYLDADLWFTAPLALAWNEIHGKHAPGAVVAVTPHRFHKDDYDRLRPNGLYNVSWVWFKNDPAAKMVLKRWANQVYDRCDASTCGDQKYLDEWPALLGPQLHEFKSIGIGVAPWNARSYDFATSKLNLNGPTVQDSTENPADSIPQDVVFYHFHELKRRGPNDYHLTGYRLPESCVELIYKPYLRELDTAYDLLAEMKGQA